ncbi:formimidoylglutamase [Arthrobacter sp. D1-17]
MDFPALSVDVPPHAWTGRFDGDGAAHRRWWQAVTRYAEARQDRSPLLADPPVRVTPAGTGSPSSAGRPAVVLGFCSDEGVRRNKGRTGAAKAPAAIRSALGPLAFHLDRPVLDAGDVTIRSGELEAAQARAGLAVSTLLDAGNLTVLLGGGHETAFASYLGVAGAEAVRGGKRWGVLNLDAHFDLRDEAAASSGTPFLQMARAEAAAGRALKYAVVGISEPNNTGALFATADRLGVKYLLDEESTPDTAQAFVADFLADIDALYLTIDLDVLPAAVAPGVSAPAAFGVPLPVITAVCRQAAASGKLLHVDVAELNPAFDVDNRTARVAARLINTLLA